MEWINGGWRQDQYAKTIPGVGYGIDQDGYYGFQCKDFSNAYAIYLGAPFTAGNAIVLWTVPQVGWKKVFTPEPGDVFVRNAVFNNINYGDTGCVEQVTTTGVWVVQQNLKANLTQGSPPDRMFWRFDQLLGYLRKEKNVSTADADTVKRLALAYFTEQQVEAMGGIEKVIRDNVGTETNSLVEAWANSPQFLEKRIQYENAVNNPKGFTAVKETLYRKDV